VRRGLANYLVKGQAFLGFSTFFGLGLRGLEGEEAGGKTDTARLTCLGSWTLAKNKSAAEQLFFGPPGQARGLARDLRAEG
jgi:hypothetical protein